MVAHVFINLPVKNLDKSTRFFRALGFSFNETYADETSACLVLSGDISVMLLTEERFMSFTPKKISDARKTAELFLALSVESREEVDELVGKAVAAGGTAYDEPEDHGFMYGHVFQDLDGHAWEVFYMDSEKFEQEKKQSEEDGSVQ
ncbi:MAG: VOC family protein [Spirochaetales bacterium]|nr:VOC family protein [Spirochaetales bacterium]